MKAARKNISYRSLIRYALATSIAVVLGLTVCEHAGQETERAAQVEVGSALNLRETEQIDDLVSMPVAKASQGSETIVSKPEWESLPELRSSYLEIETESVIEWEYAPGHAGKRIEALVEHAEAGQVYVVADKSEDGIWEVIEAAHSGEYVVLNETVSTEEWAAIGAGQVMEQGELFTRIGFEVESLSDEASAHAYIENVLPEEGFSRNALIYPVATPNDPGFAGSWTLSKLELEPVWEKYGFSPEAKLGRRAVIAVIDNGAPTTDLHSWVNSGEIAGNGIDDDGNGYVDDVNGYNFYQNNADVSYAGGHGSTVSKIAASLTNNGTGNASPASSAALMRVLYYESSVGTLYDGLNAMRYAIENGADVVNCSFVSSSASFFSYILDMAASEGVLVVAAAGNNRQDLANASCYPGELVHSALISVGASDSADNLGNSNYSAELLDIFAPGGATSYSTPLVSSTAALLKALKPSASPSQISSAIVSGADYIPALDGLCVANGRLNVKGAVESLMGVDWGGQEPEPTPPSAPSIQLSNIGETDVTLSWSCSEAVDSFEVEYSEAGSNYLPLEPSSVFTGDTSSTTVAGLASGANYSFRIRATCGALASDWTESAAITTLVPEPKPAPQPEPEPEPEPEPKTTEEDPKEPDITTVQSILPKHFWSFDLDPLGADLGTNPKDLNLSGVSIDNGISNEGGGIRFSGMHNGMQLPNSINLNKGEQEALTISLWVKLDNSAGNSTSIIYDQGGYWRGLNILVIEGRLIVNGWNSPTDESAWTGTTLQAGKLEFSEWHHVALVLDAGESIVDDGLRLYIDGQLVGSGRASKLWAQGDNNGIGQVQQSTLYRNRQVLSMDPFQGIIDNIIVWNRPLNHGQIQDVILQTYPDE